MNAVAASQLAGVLLPAARRDPAGGVPGGGGSGKGLANLPRLVDGPVLPLENQVAVYAADTTVPPKSVEFTTFRWPSLLKQTRRMLLTGDDAGGGSGLGLEPGAVTGRAVTGRVATKSIRVDVVSSRARRGRGGRDADGGPEALPDLVPVHSRWRGRR